MPGGGVVLGSSSGSSSGSTFTQPSAAAASADTGSGSSGSSQKQASASQRSAGARQAAARERYLKQVVTRYQGCLGELSPQGERALILRTGEDGGRVYSPAQVARMLKVSQSREYSIEQSAVSTLRGYGRSGACSAASQTSLGTAVAGTLAGVVPFGVGAVSSSSPLVASTNGGAGAGSGSAHASGSGGTSNPSINYATLRPPAHAGGGFPLLVLVLLGVAALLVVAFGPEYVNHRRLRMAAEATFAAPLLLRKPAANRPGLRRSGPPPAALPIASEEPAETAPYEDAQGVPYDADATHYEEAAELPPAPADAQAPAPGSLPAVRASEPSNGTGGRSGGMLAAAASLGGALRLFARNRRERSASQRKSGR